MTEYTATYPTDVAVDDRLKKFISSFFAISDDPSKNEEWVGSFTPLAYFVLGDRKAQGEDELRKLREGMWEHVKSRKHKVDKVFPATFERRGLDPEWKYEYMLQGTVDYEMKTGEKIHRQWAGHACIVDEDGLKIGFYDIYIRV